MPLAVVRNMTLQIMLKLRPLRPRTYETHLTVEHIEQLREFIKAQATDELLDMCLSYQEQMFHHDERTSRIPVGWLQAFENLSTLLCGGGTVVYGVMGCVPTVVTGPANAILNISGDPDWRFVGGIWFGLFFILLGLFAPSALQVGLALPVAFIATLAGLAMIPVLQSAFVAGFGGRFSLSALVTFLTTVAGVSIYGIGAAFWGLVFGYAVARIVERRDFDEPGRQE